MQNRKRIKCDWCGKKMKRLAPSHWGTWIYKCTGCHHEKQDI